MQGRERDIPIEEWRVLRGISQSIFLGGAGLVRWCVGFSRGFSREFVIVAEVGLRVRRRMFSAATAAVSAVLVSAAPAAVAVEVGLEERRRMT